MNRTKREVIRMKTTTKIIHSRQDMKDIQTAKYYIDHFLRQTEEEQRTEEP